MIFRDQAPGGYSHLTSVMSAVRFRDPCLGGATVEAKSPHHQRVKRGSVSRANKVTVPQPSEYQTAT